MQPLDQALQRPEWIFVLPARRALTGAMGLLGLVLAVVGVYSVASYAAFNALRRSAFAWHRSNASDILKMVLRQGIGIVGMACSPAWLPPSTGTRLLLIFFTASHHDPVTYAAVATTAARRGLAGLLDSGTGAPRVFSPTVALHFE